MANSAFYGLPRKVTSIREAINFLGFKTIRQIAMTVGVFDLFVGKTDEDSLRRRAWWRHSVDSGVSARYLVAQLKGMVSAEDAYTSGLLHWIGKSLLDRFGKGEYRLVEQLIERNVGVIQAEQSVYQCDHISVAMAAAEKWGFPESLVHALNYMNPVEEGDPYAALRSVVAISDLISQYAIEGISEDNGIVERTLPLWAISCLNITPDRMPEIIDGGVNAIAQAAALNL
jgi:HD-like signal output (HDOD) protein